MAEIRVKCNICHRLAKGTCKDCCEAVCKHCCDSGLCSSCEDERSYKEWVRTLSNNVVDTPIISIYHGEVLEDMV